MTVMLKRRLFTVDEYHRMGEVGILDEDDRVELLDGEIVEMSPIGSPHAGTVNRLTALFATRLQGRAVAHVQNPVPISKWSEPQPDVTLLRWRADYYARSHPGPEDVLLLIEVMDSSVEKDRRVKLPLYAKAGLLEVWLVNLTTGQIEVHRGPEPTGYREHFVVGRGESLSVAALPDAAFTVEDLIGPA